MDYLGDDVMELLHSCCDQALQYYGDLLLAAEKTLREELYQKAEAGNNNQEQRRYFDAMQQLQRHSTVMHAVFRRELADHYQHFVDGSDVENSPEEKIDAANLSLVRRDKLEDELAVSVIVSRSNSRNSERLWKLNRRLAALRGGQSVSDESNPFGPARICHAMQSALAELNFENKVRIVAYKHLGKIFVLSFSKLLDTLNENLCEQGILPNLRFTVGKIGQRQQRGQPSNQSDSSRANSEGVDGVSDARTSVVQQQALYSAIVNLQLLQGANRNQSAAGVSYSGVAIDGSGADAFSPLDYALALSAVQQSTAFLAAAKRNSTLQGAAVESKFFGQLAQQGDPKSRHKMATTDANMVDLVGMIFRYMLDDPNVNDAVKSTLSHLHTPFLKLALLDAQFLDNPKHSARALLNIMADLGGRWVKSDSDRQVLPKIKMTVATILRDFIDDDSMFEPLLNEFISFKENLEKRSKMVERRNTESQQGQEHLTIAKLRATEELRRRLADAGIETAVAAVLEKPCEAFLSYSLLRHGEKTPIWQSALAVVDTIIAAAAPISGNDAQHQLSAHEATASQELDAMGTDRAAAATLMLAMRDAWQLSQSLTKQHRARELKPTEPTPATITENPTEDRPEDRFENRSEAVPKPMPVELEKMMLRLSDIAFGTWFEFNEGDVSYPLKLAWYSKVSSNYMFVDSGGVKQRLQTQLEIAKGLVLGQIFIATPNKESFMERALATVLNSLKRQS